MTKPKGDRGPDCTGYIKGASKNCFCHENERNFPRLWRKVKIAAGIAKAMSRTNFVLTTPPEEIAAVLSKNEFFRGSLNLSKIFCPLDLFTIFHKIRDRWIILLIGRLLLFDAPGILYCLT